MWNGVIYRVCHTWYGYDRRVERRKQYRSVFVHVFESYYLQTKKEAVGLYSSGKVSCPCTCHEGIWPHSASAWALDGG